MDEMDLEEQYGSLEAAFAKWRGRTLLVSFDTDWLFPVSEAVRVEGAMRENGTAVLHDAISSHNGHDTFLIDYDLVTPVVKAFLSSR
jgi:homoserine O-acetyltransferase/O-succinyltransferase